MTSTVAQDTYQNVTQMRLSFLKMALGDAMDILFRDKRTNNTQFKADTADLFANGEDFTRDDLRAIQDKLRAATNEDVHGPMCTSGPARRLITAMRNLDTSHPEAFNTASKAGNAFLARPRAVFASI